MRSACLCLALLAILLNAGYGYGDSVAWPSSYSTVSANGKYVFVMLAPVQSEKDGIALRLEDQKAAQGLRAKYHVSGLYTNDGSTTPLWTVDWYAYSVLVASDGVHLVREGPWAENSFTEAFSFVENGREIRSYRVTDLLDTTLTLPHTVSHFQWEKSMRLDDSSQTLLVTTLNKDRYTFDMTTGSLTSAHRPMRTTVLIAASLVVAAIAFLVVRRRRPPLSGVARMCW